MVGVTIDCRLGNQLFQYAFIRALSQKLNTVFLINDKFEKFIAADYFDLDGYNRRQNLVNKVYFKLRYGGLYKKIQSNAIGQYQNYDPDSLSDGKIYHGYFQSALFFTAIAPQLSSMIQVKRIHQDRFNAVYGSLFGLNRVIAVHIRRGDYLNLNDWWAENLGSSNLTLPVSFYHNCLDKVCQEGDQVIFISDDIAFARSAFRNVKNAVFAGEDVIMDFQIMLNAAICIVSNSSFSWWAAYLNIKKNKQIYCPRHWLGFKIDQEYPDNIIPPDWIKVTV